MKCPVCQSTAFDEDNVEEYGELQCLDCLAICDAKSGKLIEIDGIRDKGAV